MKIIKLNELVRQNLSFLGYKQIFSINEGIIITTYLENSFNKIFGKNEFEEYEIEIDKLRINDTNIINLTYEGLTYSIIKNFDDKLIIYDNKNTKAVSIIYFDKRYKCFINELNTINDSNYIKEKQTVYVKDECYSYEYSNIEGNDKTSYKAMMRPLGMKNGNVDYFEMEYSKSKKSKRILKGIETSYKAINSFPYVKEIFDAMKDELNKNDKRRILKK